MATTTYGVNDAYAVKLWAKKLAKEALKQTYIERFIGTGSSSLIHEKTDLSKGSGDRLTFGIRMQLTGAGVTEGQVLEGNEESLTTYSDSLLINELAHAVRVKSNNTIDAQRVPYDLREEAKDGLVDWFAGRMDQIFFSHISGDTLVSQAVYSGNNSTIAPTTGRVFRPNGRANDGALVAGDELTVGVIDAAVEIAKTATPLIRPIRIQGGEYYVMFIHPSQVTSLRASAATAGSWADIQKAAIQGGQTTGNPIFNGSLGMWNGVILHDSTRLPQGINAGAYVANTRRAVLCGAQAVALGFGAEYKGEQRYKWVEAMYDYDRELGVSAQCILGLKKVQFNGVDYGTIVLPTRAVPAA